MKSIFISALIGILIITGISSGYAQTPAQTDSISAWKIGVRSVGIGAGYYSPSLGYLNNESDIKNWDTKFKGAALFAVNLELSLRKELSVRIEADYWKGTAKQTSVSDLLGGGSKLKEIKLVPVSAILLYNLTNSYIITPYVGLGAGAVFINSKNEMNLKTLPSTLEKTSSVDMMFYGVGGVRYSIAKQLSVGGEVRYALGNYNEEMADTQKIIDKRSISLNGIQLMVSLNYTFGK